MIHEAVCLVLKTIMSEAILRVLIVVENSKDNLLVAAALNHPLILGLSAPNITHPIYDMLQNLHLARSPDRSLLWSS